MNKKKLVNVLMGVLALLLVVGMAYQFTPSLGSLFNKEKGTPALTVNGTAVTVEQLEAARRSNPVLSSTDTGVLGDDFKTFVVAQQIDQTLVSNAVKDIRVSRKDVNAKVTEVREANDLTDNKKWTDALQGVGLTDSEYRQQVRQSLAIERKVEELKKAVPAATDAELQAYYDLNSDKFQTDPRIQGRQIVVADKAKAQALLTQLKGGADFAGLASANSTEFKDRGGALGPIENGAPRPVAQVALPSEVGTAAFALKDGGLTDVVESGGKFYIVKVEKYLPPTRKPFAEAKSDVSTTVNEQKKNAAVEAWVEGLRKDAKVEFKDLNWKVENPTVATVGGQSIPYSQVIEQVVNNQQFAGLLQQVPADQAAQLVNGILKPQVVQQLIQGYAASALVERLKLNLVGTRQELAAGIAAYGARNVKVSDADVQAFYTQNKAQFESPASATVTEASFKDQAKAVAFRNGFSSGDFAQAAGKAGGTVSERGSVTGGDGKLSEALNAAVFSAKSLRDAGEGSLSDVVKVGDRYSVLYITDLQRAATQPLSAVRGQIETQVLAQKKSEEGQKFLQAQVATLKPSDKLKEILAAQEKRVAAAAPKTTPAQGAAGKDGTKGSADAAGSGSGAGATKAPPADK
ncbi:peptidyl-prolyl cis-trans isomerase [Deinococcus taeanensis]|uniref:peptidyl-prolyl cis-trans isomerase n=1 Tax=Deinococcus taeanensis TaxID=2737050 RepID=UPI001CDC66B3|nr:peptidyl-prolyl cis-trans isomerase [Deinococcus taeanensis]UBV43267.1 peptidyl-prolyl cis-trans isomerase [Deinococcus taeanensis]